MAKSPLIAREVLSPQEYRAAELRRLGFSRAQVAMVVPGAETLLSRVRAKLGPDWRTADSIVWDPIPQSRRDAAQAYRLLTARRWGPSLDRLARIMRLAGARPAPDEILPVLGLAIPQSAGRSIGRDRATTLRLHAAARSGGQLVTLTPAARFALRPVLQDLLTFRRAKLLRVDRLGDRLGERGEEIWYRIAHRGAALAGATYSVDSGISIGALVRAYVESGHVWALVADVTRRLDAWEAATRMRLHRPDWATYIQDALGVAPPDDPCPDLDLADNADNEMFYCGHTDDCGDW